MTTCGWCLPAALASEAQTALTPREVCGPGDGGGRARVTDSGVNTGSANRSRNGEDPRRRQPCQVPSRAALRARLSGVPRVIYPLFNEGFAASSGELLTRHHHSGEAIRVARLLIGRLSELQAEGVLALMLPRDCAVRRAPRRIAIWSCSTGRITARCEVRRRSPTVRRGSCAC